MAGRRGLNAVSSPSVGGTTFFADQKRRFDRWQSGSKFLQLVLLRTLLIQKVTHNTSFKTLMNDEGTDGFPGEQPSATVGRTNFTATYFD